MSRHKTEEAYHHLAVIVVNFNAGSHLDTCLDALSRQTFHNFLTIVVDNASTDGSANGLESRYPNITVLRPGKNLGFASGNNLGLTVAHDCKWIALLNPDAFPAPNWLERFVSAAEGLPKYDFFGCRMRLAGTPELLDGTGDIFHVSGIAWRRDHGIPVECGTTSPGEIFGPCAAAALYSRAALLEVGGFDENYFCYHEDVDLAFRLRLRGHRCWYVPDAMVDHIGSAITGRRSDFSTYYGHRNLLWTFVKNMPLPLLLFYFPLHLAMSLVAIALCASRGQFRIILRAKYDALWGLPRVLAQRQGIQASRTATARALRNMMARGLHPLWSRIAGKT